MSANSAACTPAPLVPPAAAPVLAIEHPAPGAVSPPALVSLILPVYNISRPYLERCLASITAQTYPNLEIILVDDGSTNDAPQVCQAFCAREPRARYLRQDNAGVSVARNRGLDQATGAYVCFVDPDDWLLPSYVEHLVAREEDTQADIVVCGCLFCVGDRQEPNPFLDRGDCILEGMDKNALLYQLVGKAICDYYPPHIAAGVPWAKLFRRDFLFQKDLRFIPGMVRMQDNVFCLYALQEAGSVAYLDRNLYCYRKDPYSASHRYNPNIICYFEFYFDRTRDFLDRYQREELLYHALDAKTLTSINSYLVNYYFNAQNPDKPAERRRKLCALLDQPRYAQALERVDDSMLLGAERPFVHALRRRNFGLLRLMVIAREALRNRSH